jgi:hypothetical protein
VSLEASRSLGRYGGRDERRRRLLTEASCPDAAGDVAAHDTGPSSPSAPYGDGSFLEQQLRCLDLVPRRLSVVGLLLLVAMAIAGGLEAAYFWMAGRVAAGGTAIAALDIGAKGSLACWFSSLLLLAASIAALLIYMVRRHRTDDYQGRYRVWLWAAACWFLLATDQAAGLREAYRDAMVAITGTMLWGDGTLWWVATYVLILGAVGSRLVMDMRPSVFSTAALILAAVAHSLAMAGRLGWTVADGGVREAMFRCGAEMAGNLMLLAAMALHARYVLMDAEGLVPHRQREIEEPEDAGDESEPGSAVANERPTRIDTPHLTPQPPYQRPATPPVVLPAAKPATPLRAGSVGSTAPAAPSPDSHKLTKADRKALKERLIRERLERERRGM